MATTEPQASDRAGLFAKMVRVMASMERIPKRGRNSHFNYDFVTDGDVLDAVRAALVEQKIAFFVSFDDVSHRDKGITTGRFTLTFADADTGQTFEVHTVGEGQDTQDKGAAKALTSAVKYALLKTFLISTGQAADDPDAGAPRKKAKRQAKAKKPAVQVKPVKTYAPDDPKRPFDDDNDNDTPATDYPTDHWDSFRDYVVKNLDHYTSGEHVANTLKGIVGADPWLDWTPEKADEHWQRLTERVAAGSVGELQAYASDDPARPLDAA